MTKNFTKDEPGKCAEIQEVIGPYKKLPRQLEHDFQVRSFWSHTCSVLYQFGTQYQIVSKILPIEYSHCRNCHWKRISTIIDTTIRFSKNNGLPGTEESVVFIGVADEKEAIQQMMEIVNVQTLAYMQKGLSKVEKSDG